MQLMSEKQIKLDQRILIETLVILGVTIILSFLLPQLKGPLGMIPIVYLHVERHIRKRSFSEIGFKFKSTLKDVKDNWHLILVGAIVTQPVALLIAKGFLPDYIAHIQSRIPMFTLDQLIPLLIMVTILTFAEEIAYRGLFQERFRMFLGTTVSIIIPSVIFSIMHYSPGPFIVVAYDIFTIFIDSLIYGVVYHRTKNIVAAWIPHYLGDISGLVAMLLLFR
jgi:membrane protease YdiL (CAAX protease family)